MTIATPRTATVLAYLCAAALVSPSTHAHAHTHDHGSGAPVPAGLFAIQSAASGVFIRHCSYELYGCVANAGGPAEDFVFHVVPALNGASGAVSFESSNYPNQYITLASSNAKDLSSRWQGVEPTRLGIAPVSSAADKATASFSAKPGRSDPSLWTFTTMSNDPSLAFAVLALDGQLEGACAGSYSAPSSDAVLTASPPSAASATWNLTTFAPPPPPPLGAVNISIDASKVTHEVSPLYKGCHSDSGYVNQPLGFYSQMVYGESFEPSGYLKAGSGWTTVASGGVSAKVFLDDATAFHGYASERIEVESAPSQSGGHPSDGTTNTSWTGAGVANRGIGNEGLFLEAGKPYEGYFFAKASAGTIVHVALEDYIVGTVLDSVAMAVPGGGDWSRLNFTLVPSRGTTCEGIVPGSDPNITCGNTPPLDEAGDICVKCGGQLSITLHEPGSVNVDFVFLQPGAWGRLAPDIPVLSSAVSVLQSMGITAIRQGGSFASVSGAYYFWKNWRGPPEARPSHNATWGASLIGGWGPFEFVDMCVAAGFEPIVTTFANGASAEDMADLVEYCWGDSSTTWGATRIADGHPDPYRLRWIELGNEEYNVDYVAQVTAMEARATKLGMPMTLNYVFPQNSGPNATDITALEKLGLGTHLVTDVHVGATGGVQAAEGLFEKHPDYGNAVVNFETNCRDHTFKRVLTEGADLNDFANAGLSRLMVRAASFCTGRSGHFDSWEQAIVFFLPNMTWMQPPAYVHKLYHDNIAYGAVKVAVNGSLPSGLSAAQMVSAQLNGDGNELVVRIVNTGGKGTVTIAIDDSFTPHPVVSFSQLQHDDLTTANTPSNPTAVVPTYGEVHVANEQTLELQVPSQSYTTLVFARDSHAAT